MKHLLLITLCILSWSSFAQNINGTYLNGAGQELIITNEQECCFDFEVTWGLDDEWGCLFNNSGNATFSGPESAYSGEDPEWADIEFNLSENAIDVRGGLGWIGEDCAKFGNSSSEMYTHFVKQHKKEVNPEEISSLLLIYKGGEFLGYCYEHFETEGGQEIQFTNPDFGIYRDNDGMCGMKDEYVNRKFRVDYVIGTIEIYIEDIGDEEIETEVITKIHLVD